MNTKVIDPRAKSRYRGQRFLIKEIADAIEVRGELEAMAVRQASERGLRPADEEDLSQMIARSDALLAGDITTDVQRDEWVRLNCTFHARLIDASGILV